MTTPTKYKFKTRPSREQRIVLKRAIQREKYGVFFQQRVGKTKVAIDFCGFKHLQKGITKVLIVCPLSVRTGWEENIVKELPTSIPRYVELYPDRPNKVEKLLKATKNTGVLTFLIINYDKLTSQRKVLEWWNADIIIFDESHLLKRHTSKRSTASAALTKRGAMVLLLTGTPITKSWTDIFSQFKVMDSTIFGERWTKFRDKYAIMGGYMGKEIVGCTDIAEIKNIIKNNSARVLRKHVMNEPEVEHITLKASFEPEAQRRYKELKVQWLTELQSGEVVAADLAITRMLRLQQFCGGFATGEHGVTECISTAKVKLLNDIIHTRVEGNEQVVVFHRFKAEAELIKNTLKSYKVGLYNGSVSESDRQTIMEDFRNGALDVIVVQIATGSMGISFDTAHVNIFYSMDFSLMNYLQARDRIMGRGQKSDVVTNYYLAIINSIDVKIINALTKKEDFASSVIDSYRSVLKEK